MNFLQPTLHYQLECAQFKKIHMIRTGEFAQKSIDCYKRILTLFFSLFFFFFNLHRIAIAGNNKRISLLDLATLKPNNIQMHGLTSKIQGKVLSLSWHPKHENLLAFSTNEGRVREFSI